MEPFFHLDGIRHRYNGRLVLDIPEMEIEQGSITGLAGPNGSGKSTLLRILAQAERCTTGTVLVSGKPSSTGNADPTRPIVLLPQEAYLLKRSVFDNIAYGLRIRGRGNNLRAAVTGGLTMVGLEPDFADRKWHELSGGEAQRVALAARLVLRPSCLLLDEPTASVDLKSNLLIRQAILHAREQWGTTLVIASHHRPWLNDLCDRMLFLYSGRLLNCSPDNLLPGPWETSNGSQWFIRLGDGQLLCAPRPPSIDCTGVLPPTELQPDTETLLEEKSILHGTVTALQLDKHLNGISIQVNCGGLLLHAMSPMHTSQSHTYRPGQKITLRYTADSIIWLG